MAKKTVVEKIRSMSREEKDLLVRKIGQAAYDWGKQWGG